MNDEETLTIAQITEDVHAGYEIDPSEVAGVVDREVRVIGRRFVAGAVREEEASVVAEETSDLVGTLVEAWEKAKQDIRNWEVFGREIHKWGDAIEGQVTSLRQRILDMQTAHDQEKLTLASRHQSLTNKAMENLVKAGVPLATVREAYSKAEQEVDEAGQQAVKKTNEQQGNSEQSRNRRKNRGKGKPQQASQKKNP